MPNVTADVFAYGLAAGLSGTAFLATVIVLSTQQGVANAVGLLAGVWLVLGVAVVGAALLADVVIGAGGDQVVVALVQLLLGLWLLQAAWRVRPGQNDGPDIAARLAGMAAKAEALEPVQAVKLGVGVALLPKRLVITLLAGAAIGAAGVATAQGLALSVLYLLVATALIWGTLTVFVVGGKRASRFLEAGRAWVVANAMTLAFAVALLFGVLFTGQGLLKLIA